MVILCNYISEKYIKDTTPTGTVKVLLKLDSFSTSYAIKPYIQIDLIFGYQCMSALGQGFNKTKKAYFVVIYIFNLFLQTKKC